MSGEKSQECSISWYGKYYYRSVRINGRQKKLYVGHGAGGEIAAYVDQQTRKRRQAEKAEMNEFLDELKRLDSDLDEFEELRNRTKIN